MNLAPGARLGPYEIVSAIGAGGMGEVYKAKDMRLDRMVAVKVVPEELAKSSEALARFEREAKAVAALSHPNIVGLLDVGNEGDLHYAVMELLEGETLRDRLAAGAIPVRKAVEIAREIATGLAAAHESGVVHRDLKPENVFLTRDGRVKLLDFGLAKSGASAPPPEERTSAPTDVPKTEPGKVMRTVGYMSPEQVRGEPVDARSDVFSFGVVLYEMLGGRRPFKGDTPVQTMAAILEQDPPELTSIRPIPAGLERIVGHCLEKRPETRFQSTRDLAFDLQSIGSGSGGADTISTGTVERRTRWRPTLLVGTTAAACLALALALGLTGWLHLGRPSPPPAFKRLTFFRGTVDRAAFANHGQTILYSARVDGQPSSLYSLAKGTAEPVRLGPPGTHLLSVSEGNDLLVLRNPRIWFDGYQGTLTQATQAGAGLREIEEGVYRADWAPDAQRIAVLRQDDAGNNAKRIEFPLGRTVYRSGGMFSSLRVSPDGKRLLFLERDWAPGAAKLLQILGPDARVETLARGPQLGSAI